MYCPKCQAPLPLPTDCPFSYKEFLGIDAERVRNCYLSFSPYIFSLYTELSDIAQVVISYIDMYSL